jgi:hypothetical protein
MGVPATSEKLVAAGAATVSVALAPGPGVATSLDVTVLVVTVNGLPVVVEACACMLTLHDAPAASAAEKFRLLDEKPPVPGQVMPTMLPNVIPDGKLTLKVIPVSAVPFGLVTVTSYTVVFDPPTATVEGVKLVLNVAWTCADAWPRQIVTSASDNQAERSLNPIIATSQKYPL